MVDGSPRPASVFFDAEGTLYLPKLGHSYREFWEGGEPTLERAARIFQLDPDAPGVLRALRRQGVRLVVASKHREALLRSMLIHFGIWHLFDAVLVGDEKGVLVADYLRERGLRKDDAVMIGDRPHLDVHPVEAAGVRAYLLRREHNAREGGAYRIWALWDVLRLVSPRGIYRYRT